MKESRAYTELARRLSFERSELLVIRYVLRRWVGRKWREFRTWMHTPIRVLLQRRAERRILRELENPLILSEAEQHRRFWEFHNSRDF